MTDLMKAQVQDNDVLEVSEINVIYLILLNKSEDYVLKSLNSDWPKAASPQISSMF